MPISDEQRAAVSQLALDALDTIEAEYDDATLGDAVLAFEVIVPSGDTHIEHTATTIRPVVVAGLLTLALDTITRPASPDDDQAAG